MAKCDRPGPERERGASRSESLIGGLEETRSRLEERGERLRGLQGRSEQLQNDASSFEAMAKQLRDREVGRKWWQL